MKCIIFFIVFAFISEIFAGPPACPGEAVLSSYPGFVLIGNFSKSLANSLSEINYLNILLFTAVDDFCGHSYEKYFYLSRFAQLSWVNARSYCRSYDMDLAEVNSSNEIFLFWYFMGLYGDLLGAGAFIGGIRAKLDGDSPFYWVSSGKILPPDIRWKKNKPDFRGKREACTALSAVSKGVFGLEDEQCENVERYFVCEDIKLIPQ